MANEKILAEKIHKIILNEISDNDERRLSKVIISCDATDSIDIKILNEHWHQMATEPQLLKSHIEIQHRQQLVRCILCNRDFELDEQTLICPFCHCEQFKIIHKPPVIEAYQFHE